MRLLAAHRTKDLKSMVSRRETILCFAQACKGEALDCPPKGDHACAKRMIKREYIAWFPFGKQSCASHKHASANILIVTLRVTMVTDAPSEQRVTILCFAQAWFLIVSDCFPLGNKRRRQQYAFKTFGLVALT